MSRPPHALDYHGHAQPQSRSQFLANQHGNFIAGAVFGFSVTLIAVLTFQWIDKSFIDRLPISYMKLALALLAIGLLTTLFAIILFFRRRRFPVGVVTGARHGLFAGIGLAITMIGVYFFMLTVLAIGV